MRVNDEVARRIIQARKPGYLPSRFKPGYWINDTEAKFEQWLYDQGYRPAVEFEGKPLGTPLEAKEINPYASKVTAEQWNQVCVFASRLDNLFKRTAALD